MIPFNRELLRPGDVLLYRPKWYSLTGWIIGIKTWHWISHCEAFVGHGESVASRDGIGVGLYPFREEGLAMVLRPPVPPFDLDAAMAWFETVKGQKYDWLGLLRFAWRSEVRNASNEQFCSEMLTRWIRNGHWRIFGAEDADAIPPWLFETAMPIVWSLAPIPEEQDLF